MASENSQNRVSWEVAFGNAPRAGSRAMPQNLDFSVVNPIEINLSSEQMQKRIEFVQSMYIDNSSNPAPLTIKFGGTAQTIIIPPGYQAYIPVLATTDNFHALFTTNGTPVVPIQYLSFPVAIALWAANGGTSGGSVGTDYSANVPSLAGLTLLSTVPVNASRNQIIVQNQSLDTLTLVQDNGSGGSPSYTILNPSFSAGAQGGAWSDNYFRGRLRVYSSGSSSQISVREE